jgi:methyltransferase-like protein
LDPVSTDTVKISFKNGSFRTNSPMVKAAFLELESSWPHALSVDELFERSRKVLREQALPEAIQETQTRQVLAVALLQTVLSGFTVAHVHPPQPCTHITDKPTADAFVRLQARAGVTVTNLCHEIVALSQVARQILVDLDGNHTLEALAETLEESIRCGDLNLSTDGEPITSPSPEVLASLLDHGLEQIREAMLLSAAAR